MLLINKGHEELYLLFLKGNQHEAK